jgi:hypothetical protein
MKQGVCCTCQITVDLVSAHGRIFREMSEHGYEQEDVLREFGESAYYLCAEHDSFGERCEGSNMVPQVILKGE